MENKNERLEILEKQKGNVLQKRICFYNLRLILLILHKDLLQIKSVEGRAPWPFIDMLVNTVKHGSLQIMVFNCYDNYKHSKVTFFLISKLLESENFFLIKLNIFSRQLWALFFYFFLDLLLQKYKKSVKNTKKVSKIQKKY